MPEPASTTPAFDIVRIPPERRVDAAERLVGVEPGARRVAAMRLVASAGSHGIDLDLLWGSLDLRTGAIREACLGVVGAGRTAMLFLPGSASGPRSVGRVIELAATIRAACDGIAIARGGGGRGVQIVQALPVPDDVDTNEALRLAGFRNVGELTYLRKSNRGSAGRLPPAADERWGPGVEVRTYASLSPVATAAADAVVIEALERSYEATLDCPELCGLRETADVLDSHRATGEWNPALWWVVLKDARPLGCMLFNVCRAQSSAELVYLGMAPSLRGAGLGSRLLAFGLARVRDEDAAEVTCAVDSRNEPAIRLYRRAGFRACAKRCAMVRRSP